MPTKMTAAEALQTIMAGNERWAKGESHYPKHGIAHSRDCLENGQHPFAVVLGCSDSRKPIELVMDVGLGDVFVVRNAGHTLCDCTLASIEFGVLELGAPLLMVMGHQNCGAVTAAANSVRDSIEHRGHIGHIVEKIAPAARAARQQHGDIVENTIKLHIQLTVSQLLTAQPVLSELAKSQALSIVGAYYNLETRRLSLTTPSTACKQYTQIAAG